MSTKHNSRQNILGWPLLGSLLKPRSVQLIIVCLLMILAMTIAYGEQFANSGNIKSLLISFVSTGMVSIGMMGLLITGVFDLSIGSTYAMAMIMIGYSLKVWNVHWILAIFFTLCICLLIGIVNGILVTRMKINPLIATLAMMGIVRGLAVAIGGVGVRLPDPIKMLGQSEFLGLRIPIWVFFVIAGIFIFLFKNMKFFRKFYFVGGNEEASKLCGIEVNRIRFAGYLIIAFLTGIAGVLHAARLGSSTAQVGIGMELSAIAGVVIGGASLKGGKGTIVGGIMGAFFMAIVFNIMVISGVSAYWQQIVNGVILILAVYMDVVIEEGYLKKIFRTPPNEQHDWGKHTKEVAPMR